MKRLSIIVPVYNVESYVEKCIRSLADQDISREEYEIICVNDGSTDTSRRIIIQLQKEYNNIYLIDQENQGVSIARNNGINNATGRFILFIDADDFIDSDCLGRILNNAETRSAQVCFLGYTILNEDGTIKNTVFYENLRTQENVGTEAYFIARGDGKSDPDRIYAVLFETSFINLNNLRFTPGVPYLEDGELISRILCLADRCIYDGYSFYQRTTRPGSATNSKLFYSEKATNGFLKAASNLKKFQLEQNLSVLQKSFINQPIVKFVILAVDSSITKGSNEKLVKTIAALKELKLRKVLLKDCSRIYRMYGNMYNISPYLLALTLILYPRIKRIFHYKVFR